MKFRIGLIIMLTFLGYSNGQAQFGYPDPKQELNLFPNPAHKEFNVSCPGLHIHGLRIFNIQGALMESSRYTVNTDDSGMRVEVEALDAGVYYLHLSTVQGDFVEKLILY
jgi:hypothetical protein